MEKPSNESCEKMDQSETNLNLKSRKGIILPAQPSHIEAVMKIAEEAGLAKWNYNDYYEALQNKTTRFLVYINSADKIIIDKKTFILGFVLARLITNENRITHNNADEDEIDEAVCEILQIAVCPTYRNTGVGQILFEEIKGECLDKKVTNIWLEVRKENEKAVLFYQKNNFKVIYVRKNYYADPLDDALVMKTELNLE